MCALRRFKEQNLGGLPPRMPPHGRGAGGTQPKIRKRDYSPIFWDHYFDRKHDVKINEENIFRVYESGQDGPILLFLHGGGFSALSWAVLTSHLSTLVTCRCVAVDLRGHGDSSTTNVTGLSLDQMSSDVGDIVNALYGEDVPEIILIGHSMGGAISVHCAFQKLLPSLIGLVVIDVVEGSAIDALSSMQSFLRGRPKTFSSLENAIEWSVRTGQIRNVDSARVSVVGQLKRIGTQETATAELEHDHPSPSVSDTITEEEEEDSTHSTDLNHPTDQNQNTTQETQFKKPNTHSNSSQYTWRIDLSSTEKYWREWFQGLSSKFLSCDMPKLLLLAGIDRLDKDLTIGQMQGKFQMQVLPRCGHVVHEDVPDRVAEVLASFLVRNRIATPTELFQGSVPSI